MKVGAAFGSYLKAEMIKGKRLTVTIDRVEVENIGKGDEKEKKPVVYFAGKDMGLVLNKTNANKIAEVLGTDEMDEWAGGQIVIFHTLVDFGGKRVDGIRVASVPKRPSAPAPAKPVPAEEPAEDWHAEDSDVPF